MMTTTAGESHTETETDRTSELSELPLEGKSPSEYTLDVTILRFRAVAIPVAMAAFFVGVTLPFAGKGMQVGSFRSIDVDEGERKELLDKYNERLGSLTALMMKPLDVTLSMVVAVIFLMLASRMSAYLESRRRYLLIGVIGVVGYLMNTGFNSMNLQVVPGAVSPRIMPSDLVVESVHDDTQQLDAEGNLTTTWDPKFRESTPGNSVLNTILRGLFIPREEVPTHCKETDDWYYATAFKNVLPSYGFPSRTWQQNALSKALEPTASLSMPMNAAESDLEQYDDLPMSKAIATNLVVYSLVVSNTFLGWWTKEDEAWGSFSHANATGKVVLADYFNLTTRSTGNANFASTARQVIIDYYDKAELSRTSDELAKVEFTRVNLTETIVFDALTIEIPTRTYGTQRDNSSSTNPFYWPLYSYACNTKACLLADNEEYKADGNTTAIHPRVQALAICLNDQGEETLVVDNDYSGLEQILQSCTRRSTTSMMVVSLGKRIEGDSLVSSSNTVENARMVYSLTVGRLAWRPENFSETYNAECKTGDGCRGIRFPLGNNGTLLNDHLLVSESGIPMSLLSPINLNWNWFPISDSQWKMLATTVDEPRAALEVESKPSLIVLPRNFNTTDGSSTAYKIDSDYCLVYIDRHLNQIEKNHLYIEHSLQPAYTAGLYFIFQNAVVLKQINGSDGPSLEFSGNILDMHIWASIPKTSMIFAFIGCFIMVLGGVAIAVLSKRGEDSLAKQDSATVAAEALDNTEKYPPSLLRLQLRNRSTGKTADAAFDSLCVDSVVLAKKEDKTQQFAISKSVSPSANTPTISRLDSAGA
ncbi:hypothetical protein PHYSODRAFT_307464 [Phytophthora sojae]|uniref:Transmembrane protein n=1 Tax=Phytophthora sojae (strain P6497) TaxID=1094619 RepID=G5AEP9_PHYSP|nr:hypothetical protein PHYSODRAFT_307464 [Phytophthora sojae]EGZ05689.1 hypothetical protein PHYSODRAFT_307464 [Phytophthora sojae]|eukprot:XP_009538550.1 hypothetical protein PHYSODRAFT_307464 [Phytophthora sojae]